MIGEGKKVSPVNREENDRLSQVTSFYSGAPEGATVVPGTRRMVALLFASMHKGRLLLMCKLIAINRNRRYMVELSDLCLSSFT
jgi:hypothetical protein